ncbi:hypothetical protein FA13DRAFT_1140149 [Coprinellus micaceus]|uniref:Uncharacterized protein n=1 Tax=Coprinellus micaceus TaxID=71717 RepID=A0A4Y7SVG4_COPMI|nr:hypothetical protein FA13DRAFT_1140149 [Coprinellus micaceus]
MSAAISSPLHPCQPPVAFKYPSFQVPTSTSDTAHALQRHSSFCKYSSKYSVSERSTPFVHAHRRTTAPQLLGTPSPSTPARVALACVEGDGVCNDWWAVVHK